MSKLLEYFNTVDKNALARAAHLASPVASMSAFGLTAEEQNAVLSGSKQSLAEAIGLDAVDFSTLHTPNTIFAPNEENSGTKNSFMGEFPVIHVPNSVFLPMQQSFSASASAH